MSTECSEPIPLDTLAAYVLGELDGAAEAGLEEHYFACPSCTERLGWVQSLSRGVAAAVRAGQVTSGVRASWVDRAAREGVRLRQYDLSPGEPIQCTVGARDDFVVVRLHLDRAIAGEVVVETEYHDLERDRRERRDLVAQSVDPDARELVYAFSGDLVRSFPLSRWVMHVCNAEGERVGPFTMNHTPGA